MEDDASIQILEADADQQYVPDKKEQIRPAKINQKVADINFQKPPVLIVERQVLPQSQTQEKQNIQSEKEQPISSRIVHIVDEKSPLWSSRMTDIVSLVLRFFMMALVSFVVLVALNPPFIQEKSNGFGPTEVAMQRQPANLSKASAWAAGAGLGYIVLPPLWELLSSKYFSSDFLKAFGF